MFLVVAYSFLLSHSKVSAIFVQFVQLHLPNFIISARIKNLVSELATVPISFLSRLSVNIYNDIFKN